jgi:ubiquitin carboxyl-terminal hydrolase 4/11/15
MASGTNTMVGDFDSRGSIAANNSIDSSSTLLKDISRVVSSSAYLLFYRRRSEVPLGGPRFTEIFHKYEYPNEASDDDESGEDQGLVGNSSHHGSSRALTGVEVAHQANGSRGVEMMTIDSLGLEKLPDYESHLDNDEDSTPLLLGDSAMNDNLRESIEDEGIDMSMGYNSINYENLSSLPQATGIGGNWTFDAINANSRQLISGTGSDAASDMVENQSSASQASLEQRIEDFDETEAVDDDGNPFVEPSPVPDMDEDGQVAAIALRADLLESQMHYPGTQFDVTADDEQLEVEEPATEIHLEDHDELKLD